MPVVPSADLEKSLRFWVEGLGFTMDRPMHRDGVLIGCMVHNEHLYFWLNARDRPAPAAEDHDGIRLYWAPRDIHAMRNHLEQLGFSPSPIEVRHYGQTEFFVTDEDGFPHCFGVPT